MTDVVVAHDYFTQRGGAERVALAIRAALPGDRVLTALHEPAQTFPETRLYDVRTTALQRVGPFRRDPRRALPLLPAAIGRLDPGTADVVVCSTSGWAHGVRTAAPKLVYCHNPPRWLHQPSDYLRDQPAAVRAGLRALSPGLRRWDAAAARSAERYLVNSTVVRERVRTAYGLDAAVLPPPVALGPDGPREPVVGLNPGFFLVVGRPRGYKNVEVVCQAFRELPGERLVVVGGLPAGSWPARFTGLVDVSDACLRWLYASCRATVSVAHEDFGLTPLEGNAAGRPALCLRAGGFLDTLDEGVSGWFVEAPTPSAVVDAVRRLDREPLDPAAVLAHAGGYSLAAFTAALRRHVDEVARSA